VRLFFDSSALVPVFVPGHQHHERSLTAFSAAKRATSYSAAHCMAEVYATLTRLPGKYRAAPEQAISCLETIEEHLSVLTLEVAEYVSAIRGAAALGTEGGNLYDALIAACALKANADVIYTWNVGHFLSLGEEVARKVRTP
jgi:predicted nucleic acid-binding protein